MRLCEKDRETGGETESVCVCEYVCTENLGMCTCMHVTQTSFSRKGRGKTDDKGTYARAANIARLCFGMPLPICTGSSHAMLAVYEGAGLRKQSQNGSSLMAGARFFVLVINLQLKHNSACAQEV